MIHFRTGSPSKYSGQSEKNKYIATSKRMNDLKHLERFKGVGK